MANDFASTMRELSAEAVVRERPRATTTELAGMLREFDALDARLQGIEAMMKSQLENIANNLAPARAEQHKIAEHLSAIRTSESVNQRLFDSLHEELLKYRDNFLHETLQKPFVRDLIVLYDDLSTLAQQLAAAAAEKKRDRLARWRDNLDNAIHALLEILHRLEVMEVEAKEFVDLSVHKVVSFEPAEFAEDNGRVIMRIKRGFTWRGKVLRPEEVIAKRFQ
ncbi:MAG: nucleotide exchange factor GrpE [Chthoniobacterales bacterium]|nr:MAG: nucleotide exchange factor GrpE [Chthoniobacterales bacterium]